MRGFWVPTEGVLGSGVKSIKIMLPNMNSTQRSVVDKKGSLMMIVDD